MKHSKLMIRALLLCLIAGTLYGGNLYETRIYEPIVLLGGQIAECKGIPVDQLFVYAYKNDAWEMIPFQIDERIRLSDPDLTKKEDDRWRHFYVSANTNSEYVRSDTLDSAFDNDDELIFMLRGCGDKAPDNAWIDNEEAKTHDRIDLTIEDSNGDMAYAYVFRSSTLSMPVEVANRYGMQFDPNTHTVQSHVYSIRMNQADGLITDITLKSGYGNGQDIFDAQKFRMNGYIDWGNIPLEFGPDRNDAPSATEIILYLHENEKYLAYTEHPVVRIVREVRCAIGNNQRNFGYEGTEFYVKTKFYPYSGAFEGGAVLDPDSIKAALGDDAVEVDIRVDYLRQSWDFNSNAAGMQFYNNKNSQIPIDGSPDDLDLTVDVPSGQPLQTWSLVSGDQGSIFSFYNIAENNWDAVSLYYWDNKNGYQMDEDMLNADDSGYEYGSYADNGLRFFNTADESKAVNLDFSFTSFFLAANQTRQMAESLVQWINDTPEVSDHKIETAVESQNQFGPKAFGLEQNFPNPFNASTMIQYQLSRKSQVEINIIDLSGKEVATLLNTTQSAGSYQLTFDASNLSSGVYFIQMKTPNWLYQRKIILMK
ncbi:T9SS type A sorting domain-containing protein [bacterium]